MVHVQTENLYTAGMPRLWCTFSL